MTAPSVLMTGIQFGESPRWHDGRLWFSDWAGQTIHALALDGANEVVATIESFPFCIDFLPDGRLLVVHSADQKLLGREPDGTFVTRADLGGLSPHPWNEVTTDRRGNAFVNNIGFDFAGGEPAPGFIVVVTPDGGVRRVADDVAFPNGMVVTPDDSTLIVAESYGSCLTAFDVGADGSLANRRTWAPLGDDHPDGICIDVEGAVWYADVGNSHCVRVAEGGEVLQTIPLDRGAFSCALGGPDLRHLFIVATVWDPTNIGVGEPSGQILVVDVAVSGVPRPG
jgi:sugar lactone lactonase YvrE